MLGPAGLSFRTQPDRLRLDPVVVRQVASALLIAAVAEVVLLRLVTRVGVHLPRGDTVSDALGVASFLGAFALNLASILTTGFVVLVLAAVAWRAKGTLLGWAVIGLTGAMLWGLGLRLSTGAGTADALFGVSTTLLVIVVGLFLANEVPPRGRLAIALVVGAYVAYQYYALGHLLFQQLGYTTAPPAAIWALRLGELLVVLGAGAAFWAWGIDRWRRAGRAGAAFAIVPVFVVFAGSLAPASTSSILALWTTGLSLYLPLPLYLIALGLYLLTIAACLRAGDAFWSAAGLLLIFLAGYMPEATYDHLLLLLGVAFLAGGAASLTGFDARDAVEHNAAT